MIQQTEPVTSNSPAFGWMRQRKFHPPFVVKIEAGYEIERTQIVSLSALLYCPIWINRESFLAPWAFSVPIRHEGCICGLKCLLLSYFRIGDHTSEAQVWRRRRSKTAYWTIYYLVIDRRLSITRASLLDVGDLCRGRSPQAPTP
jgi:hypothetical protein